MIWERGVDIRIRVAKHLKYSHVQSSAFHVKKLSETRDRQEVFFKATKNVSQDQGLPGGPVVKNLTSNAGDVGSIPGQGIKTPYGEGQLSPQATTTNTKPMHFGALAPQLERRLCPATKPPCHN